MRVLVAEDEWLAADTLSVLLEEEGASVVGPFPTAAESLAALGGRRIDFALVDMRLRDEFADPLVNGLLARGIPYAVITAFEDLPTNVYDHARAVVQKPVTKQALMDLFLPTR
jgi:CheY-like chemotaxis protein